MYKSFLCFIIGIILFLLLNDKNGFSVGIPGVSSRVMVHLYKNSNIESTFTYDIVIEDKQNWENEIKTKLSNKPELSMYRIFNWSQNSTKSGKIYYEFDAKKYNVIVKIEDSKEEKYYFLNNIDPNDFVKDINNELRLYIDYKDYIFKNHIKITNKYNKIYYVLTATPITLPITLKDFLIENDINYDGLLEQLEEIGFVNTNDLEQELTKEAYEVINGFDEREKIIEIFEKQVLKYKIYIYH